MGAINILANATTTSTGPTMTLNQKDVTFSAHLVGTGAVSATVVVEVTNDTSNPTWPWSANIELSGTNNDSGGFPIDANWKYARARITAISGTAATVNVYMGV